jgi:SAM-dependent methyltransferase
MRREARRTLFSLSSKYQTLSPELYEVLVVENASSDPLDENEVLAYGNNFQYYYFENDLPSPTRAINFGVKQARGDTIGICIDGARILTPGILEYANRILKPHANSIVATLAWHLGPDIQHISIQNGYNNDVEDNLLAKADWRNNPYTLFENSALGGSSKSGWFSNVAESNCFFISKSSFEKMGGYDDRFKSPGGGFCNLDFFRRACEIEKLKPIILLGEATFHQLHGGAATESSQGIQTFATEYEQITGQKISVPDCEIEFLGHLPAQIHDSVAHSAINLLKLQENRNDLDSVLGTHYISIDKENIKRAKNLKLIPEKAAIRELGGKRSYAEWGHVIGIFQTLIYQNLSKSNNNFILDVGCGSGLLAISSEPFIRPKGQYTGIDVNRNFIDISEKNYKDKWFKFLYLSVFNSVYSPSINETEASKPWDVSSESQDLVTALSVWTHLNEQHSTFYLEEVSRVLKPGAKAIITFFVLDNNYERSLKRRRNAKGRFHNSNQLRWVFDTPLHGSDNWFHPKWTKVPEYAIGVTPKGITAALKNTDLKLIKTNTGNWKETAGIFFQDILIFEKSTS